MSEDPRDASGGAPDGPPPEGMEGGFPRRFRLRRGASGGDGLVFSVAELSGRIRALLEGSFERVAVRGEITNFSRPRSGHFYFSLIEEGESGGRQVASGGRASGGRGAMAQLPVVVWRSTAARLRHELKGGMRVVVTGRLAVYEPRGSYQLIADRVEPEGLGGLEQAFLALREKLGAEGLFDEARKKALPFLPRRIAVLTSPSGAALADFLRGIERRLPSVQIGLVPVRVQGEGAAEEIAAALGRLEDPALGIDLIVLARGGGSLEDLWAFNEEVLARAIARVSLPIAAAVGHEVDVTIADLVADRRFATPTAAGEGVVPDRRELARRLQSAARALARGLELAEVRAGRRLESLLRRGPFRDPERLLEPRFRELERLGGTLGEAWNRLERTRHEQLELAGARLHALSPLAALERGYSVVRDAEARAIRSAEELEPGQWLELILSKGRARAKVESSEPEWLIGGPGEDRSHGK